MRILLFDTNSPFCTLRSSSWGSSESVFTLSCLSQCFVISREWLCPSSLSTGHAQCLSTGLISQSEPWTILCFLLALNSLCLDWTWHVCLGLWCNAAGWSILLCFSPHSTNHFSAVLGGLYFACHGDRGPTLGCVLVSSLALRFPTHAAGLCLQWVCSLPGAAPCKPPEIKSSEDLLDWGLSAPWLVVGVTCNVLCW